MLVVAVLCAALDARAQDFYADHLQRGIANYNRGNFAQASSDLRVAAFGLLDTPADYEAALVYQLLAATKLQRSDDARQLAEKLVHTERLVPVYATLQLPAGMREEVESELPKLLTPAQLGRAPAFAALAGRSTVPPAPAPQPRTPAPAPAGPAPFTGAQAMTLLQRGDEAGARTMAEKITADDYTNALAQTVLAILAGRRNDWPGVVEHYSIVRTRRRLTPDETNTYIMGLVRSGRTVDATGVERLRGVQPFVAKASAIAPSPAPAPPPTPAAQLAEADRALGEKRIVAARDAYRRLGATPSLPRDVALAAARGLNQTAAYRDSSAVYQKLYPLHVGEELHMFYEAVNRYEMGDYAIAKKLLARALPYIPQSRDVELYRGRIERTQ
jgi:tetratricopeptide (TPR) repeat protein